MNHVTIFLYVGAVACVVTGIKVNMQGSLSLGKDVVESLSHYLGKNFLSGRRIFNPSPIEDPITLAVRTALICKDLKFCQGQLQYFVNEYIIILAKAVATILSGSEPDFNNETYEEKVKHNLDDIKKILQDANTKVDNQTAIFYWTHVIKKINRKFQNFDNILQPHIPGTVDLHNKTMSASDLLHKLVIATSFIERKYQIKLCSEYDICTKSHECTKTLNKILIHFKTMPEDRIRLFVKYFYQALFDSPFYSHVSLATANEFQIVLNDMCYANDTQTKDIMLSVLKTVEARMEMIRQNKGIEVAHEVLVAHTILSDVDHMFSNRTDAFAMFLNKFYDWMASDVQLEKHVRVVLSDISVQISSSDEELIRKLVDEVKGIPRENLKVVQNFAADGFGGAVSD